MKMCRITRNEHRLFRWWLKDLGDNWRRTLRIVICFFGSSIPAVIYHAATGPFLRWPDPWAVVGCALGFVFSFSVSMLWTRAARYGLGMEEMNEKLEEANTKLQKLSIRDHLTGLHNRRYMELQIDQLQIQAQRLDFFISIAVIDLDDLKKINDTYGHDSGDELLKMAATRMRTIIRSGDIIGRVGGDEFWIVFLHPNADPSQCEQRLRDAISNFTFPCSIGNTEVVDVPTGASVGLSIATHHDLKKAIQDADEAMYADKAIRKNH